MRPVQEIAYSSSDGVHTIVASVWLPDGEPRSVVQISHGMAEYVGRYEWLAGKLCERGFAVCGNDHLGHGRSVRSKEELGYFGPRDGYLRLVEDEHLLRKEMQGRIPGLPYFLYGHSMGSFITRLYISRWGEGLSGYLCCGTSGHNAALGFGRLLAELLVRLGGAKKKGKLLDRIAFRGYNKRFQPAVTDYDWLSRDLEVCRRYASDEGCGFLLTNAGFRDMFRLLKAVDGERWSRRVPTDLPVILLSGENDPVGGYGKGAREVYGWLREAGVRDVTLKILPGARHELHNEWNREEYVSEIVDWMEQRMSRSGSPLAETKRQTAERTATAIPLFLP